MPRVEMTARFVKDVKPPDSGRIEYWDTKLTGLGLRVSELVPTEDGPPKGGRKTWPVMYRHKGRQRRYKLGTYPVLSLADARDDAKAVLRAVTHGEDPAAERHAEHESPTFGYLASEYMEHHAKVKKKSWRKDQRALDREVLPRFKHRRADNIPRREIIAMLRDIRDGGAPIGANRVLEIVRRIYSWGVGQEIISHNPCSGIEKPSEEVRRENRLTNDEMRKVWAALDAIPPKRAACLKLILLTAQRPGEVHHMRWQDIDGDWWTIPPEFSKNGMSHRVPLSAQVLEVLEGVERSNSEWVFPSARGGPLSNNGAGLDVIRERSGTEFRLHDLRRSAATAMTGDLGIPRLVVGKILNHADRDITSVYDRASYDRDKRRALYSWGNRVEDIVSGKPRVDNVVKLAAGNDSA